MIHVLWTPEGVPPWTWTARREVQRSYLSGASFAASLPLKRAIDMRSTTMPKVEWVDVLDKAMRSGDPGAHLDGVRGAFADAGRDGVALMAAVIHALLQAGEIETVMCMRAEWAGTRRTARDDMRRADPARRLRPHS